MDWVLLVIRWAAGLFCGTVAVVAVQEGWRQQEKLTRPFLAGLALGAAGLALWLFTLKPVFLWGLAVMAATILLWIPVAIVAMGRAKVRKPPGIEAQDCGREYDRGEYRETGGETGGRRR